MLTIGTKYLFGITSESPERGLILRVRKKPICRNNESEIAFEGNRNCHALGLSCVRVNISLFINLRKYSVYLPSGVRDPLK